MTNPSSRAGAAAWSDLEQAFFAAAPPDVPEPAGEAMRFDDLDVGMAPRREAPVALRRTTAAVRAAIIQVIDALSALSFNRRNITIAIASVMLLIGLSAVVFARR